MTTPSVILSSGPSHSRSAEDDDPPYVPPRLPLGFTAPGDSGVNKIHASLLEQRRQLHETVGGSAAGSCRRLCCPVNGDHDRTHPLCVVKPLLWDGDQA